MAESRYNRLDNQAPVQTQLDNSNLSIPRSAFDFSTIHSGNALMGAVIPVDCFDVVPGEDISISMANLLEFRNPTTRQLLNGCRVYFHCYYNRLTDLWEGARNFLDTGRSGQISLERPNLIYHVENVESPGDDYIVTSVDACTPMSLLNYLGLPASSVQHGVDDTITSPLNQFKPAVTVSDNTETTLRISSLGNHVDFFPADCAFAYQKNWRDFYCNKNLLQNNKYWFPDNEDHFILSYSCENAVCVLYEDESLEDDEQLQRSNLVGLSQDYFNQANADYIHFTHEPNNPVTSVNVEELSKSLYSPNLSGLKFRQFRGDRFSTSLPFPDLIRGSIPVIELNQESFSAVQQAHLLEGQPDPTWIDGSPYTFYTNGDKKSLVLSDKAGHDTVMQVKIPASELTMNAIRELETLTVFKERMARTSGDYNDMIEAQFNVSPHVHDRTATYVGGFYQDFAFSSVTQLSQSTSGEDGSPLGQKAGQGVSSGQGTITRGFHVPDFGWIQIYMSIVPDVFYTQGKPRMFDKKVQTEMYFPIFNNLAPQYIKNKELFVDATDAVNNSSFGYEDRYAEYKSRPNRVSGFMALSPVVASFDSARIMARRFDSVPALNNNFVSMIPENIDMSVFTVADEPPFDFSCGVSVRRVFPGPYTAVPGSMSSNLHA